MNGEERGAEVGEDKGLGDVANSVERENGAVLGLSGQILKAVHREDDCAGEKSDDARKPHEIAKQVNCIAGEEDEGGLLDGLLAEGVDSLEDEGEEQAREHSEEQAEGEEVGKAEQDLRDELQAESSPAYLYSCEKSSKLATVPNSTITTALFSTPSPLATAASRAWQSFSRGSAAPGSAEARTMASRSRSLEESGRERAESSAMSRQAKRQTVSTVETTPRKPMIGILSKKCVFLML